MWMGRKLITVLSKQNLDVNDSSILLKYHEHREKY